jgi:hypothetical protein
MSLKVLYVGKLRGGTPVLDLIKMVHYNHPEVEFIPYGPKENGDVILGVNRTMAEDKRNIRKVMYLGSVPSFRKSPEREKIDVVDHTFFISEYCKNIFIDRWDFEKYSVFLPFGPLPADFNLEPLNDRISIEGPIQFVSVAKWYKRPYKRLKQILKLYHNYLKKEYPDSILNIIGGLKEEVVDGVHYHRKAFGNKEITDIFKKSHIHLIPTPFDTGPKTIPESMHYRVPFVCSNNCAGIEYIDKVGKCGIEVETDPLISSWKEYRAADPLNRRSIFVRNKIPYDKYLSAVKEIVNNFEEYTSWEWNEKLNYKKQSNQLYKILRG